MRSVTGIDSYLTPANDVGNSLRSVYILDTNPIARRCTFLFLSEHGFTPRSFTSARDFFEATEHIEPGCLLLGEGGDELGALRVIEALGDRLVEFPVVITTSHGDVATAVQAMKLGASDVFELPFGRDALPGMLESILSALGQRLSKVNSVRSSQALVHALSTREGQVLRHLARGSSNKTTARLLGIRLRTVEMHRASMMKRLGVNSLADALRIAFEAEISAWPVDPGEPRGYQSPAGRMPM